MRIRAYRKSRPCLEALEGRSVPAALLLDTGFESPAELPAAFTFDPTGSAWTFTGPSGLTGEKSGFTAATSFGPATPPPPEGQQFAFLQGPGGAISQTFTTATGGTYELSFDAAQRSNYIASHQEIQVLVDGNAILTMSPAATSFETIVTPTFAVGAGAHTLTFRGLAQEDQTAFLDAVTLGQVDPPTILDPGFETPALAPGQFKFQPAGSPWTVVGGAGVSSTDSGFTSSSPTPPEGSQVGFLQGLGAEISQTVPDWAAGTYQLTFAAAARANYNGQETVEVDIDSAPVFTFTTSDTTYQTASTPAFTVSAGAHTITFRGLGQQGQQIDETAFLDAVSLIQLPGQPDDSGFETPALPAGGYIYQPSGSPWTFAGGAGITATNSLFTNFNFFGTVVMPDGSQAAFLQGANASISQTISGWAAGSYQITFSAAQRHFIDIQHQEIQILVDGNVVGDFTPPSEDFVAFTTPAFTVTAGAHTIAFQGVTVGDETAFIDAVSIREVT